jgi:hypothetical protein
MKINHSRRDAARKRKKSVKKAVRKYRARLKASSLKRLETCVEAVIASELREIAKSKDETLSFVIAEILSNALEERREK